MDQLSKKIMRRVYYAFALRTVIHPVFVHALVLSVSGYLLAQVVSVPDVISNFMQVRVGDAFAFFYNALLNTQTATVVLLAVIVATVLSMLWRSLSNRQVVWDSEGESWA